MDKPLLLSRLEKATDTAASFVIQRGFPVPKKKNGTWVGNTLVKKNNIGLYDVISLDNNQPLYENISVLDVAIIIAQRHSNGEFKTIRKVLSLETVFSKHHTDMIHYLHCIKGAKRRQDYSMMAILEDKFQIAELRAKTVRDEIAIFKRVK